VLAVVVIQAVAVDFERGVGVGKAMCVGVRKARGVGLGKTRGVVDVSIEVNHIDFLLYESVVI